MDPSEVVGLVLAGLGLFFIGAHLIGFHFRMMSGNGLRNWISKISQKPGLGAFLGILAGAITQSTTAVTFIMTGVISAGHITVRQALPIVMWSNTGNCLLIFLAAINFHVMVLYFLGIVGFLFYIDLNKSDFFKPLVGALLGVALLFLGLDFIKAGATPLKEYTWFTDMLVYAGTHAFSGLALTGALSFLTQSGATVTAIVIALTDTGFLNLEGSLMIIYGANLGPAISTWLLSKKLTGPPKQLAQCQIVMKFSTLTLLVILFFVEHYTQAPLMLAYLEGVSSDLGIQLAIAFLTFQAIGATVITVFSKPLTAFLEKRYPQSEADQLASPKYLSPFSQREPHSMLQLMDYEIERLYQRFPTYLNTVRTDTPPESLKIESLHDATCRLSSELKEQLKQLMSKGLSQDLLPRALAQQNALESADALEEMLFEIVTKLQSNPCSPPVQDFFNHTLESIHIVLLSLSDLFKDNTDTHRHLFMLITEEKASVMNKIKTDLIAQGASTSESRRIEMLINRYERILWNCRYLSKLLEKKE